MCLNNPAGDEEVITIQPEKATQTTGTTMSCRIGMLRRQTTPRSRTDED